MKAIEDSKLPRGLAAMRRSFPVDIVVGDDDCVIIIPADNCEEVRGTKAVEDDRL